MKILLVDDNRDNVELLCQILEDEENDVIKAYSGAECIKLAKEEQPDLIILDVMMPRMDGYETFQKLREDESVNEIPVIFLTARYRDTDRVIKGLELGAFDYITKPFQDEILLAKVYAGLRISRAEKEEKRQRDELRIINNRLNSEITERKKIEKELHKKQDELNVILNSVPAMIWSKNTEGKYLSVNRAYCKIVGLSEEKIIGRTDYDLYPTDIAAQYSKYDQKVIDSGQPVLGIEERHLKPSGDYGWSLTEKLPYYDVDSDLIGTIGFALDITERKQVEEALKQTNEELLKEHNQRRILSKSLIDLLEKDRRHIAMELHDHIGQNLTSLKMNLEMIHEKLKPDNTELEAQITVAQERTTQAIKDVKNISRGLRPAMIDALGVVSALRELFHEIQQQLDIEIHFFNQGIPKRFEEGKELAIYRIAQEALSNTIRHSRTKNIFVNLIKKDDKLSLSVEDDGVGFDHDKVMKPSKKKGPLGLLIMRERAVQLDGDFTIESQPGKGTHLLVEIPL